MKKVILIFMLVIIGLSVNAQTSLSVNALKCVNKWNHNPNQLFYAPDDPLNIAADLTTLGNYMNTNSVLLGNNNSFSGTNTFSGSSYFIAPAYFYTPAYFYINAYFYTTPILNLTPDTANVTRTLTVADLASGYIKTAQGSAITLKLPTCSTLQSGLGIVGQGSVFDFYIDNTAGTGHDSIAVNTGIVAAKQPTSYLSSTGIIQSVEASTTVGVGQFEIVFISTTACILYRKQ